MALACAYVPVTAQTSDEIRAKITKINQEMARAMIAGDTERNLSFYAQDAVSMPNNGSMVEGINAIRKSTEEMIAAGVKVNSYEVQTLHTVSCEKMIIEIGKFAIRFTVPGMQAPTEDSGKYLTIWEEQPDGSLKIKIETWNSDAVAVKDGIVSDNE
jgi:uncharacterized protein (TIGR02246 family)